jgi:CBS domain-containing protein
MKNGKEQRREFDDVSLYIKNRSYGGMIIREVLDGKGWKIWTTKPESRVNEALEVMAQKDAGALVAVDKDGTPVGVISERDYARKVIRIDKRTKDIFVHEIMSSPVQVVSPDDSVASCMSLMTMAYFRHLPVCEEGRLVGLVSIGDLVKSLITDQEHLIRQYDKYISGSS